MNKLTPDEIPSRDLAYLGDAVLEVLVRRHLVEFPAHGVNPSEASLAFVTAIAQSDAVEKIKDVMNETESDIFKRARNNYHTSNVPKSATPAQYRRATGFEAVFGYLFLKGDADRIKVLFNIAFGLDE